MRAILEKKGAVLEKKGAVLGRAVMERAPHTSIFVIIKLKNYICKKNTITIIIINSNYKYQNWPK